MTEPTSPLRTVTAKLMYVSPEYAGELIARITELEQQLGQVRAEGAALVSAVRRARDDIAGEKRRATNIHGHAALSYALEHLDDALRVARLAGEPTP